MFESFKAKRAAAKASRQEAAAASAATRELSAWEHERDSAEALVEQAAAPGASPDGIVLHKGELCYGIVNGCSLVEERRGQGHFVAGSAGVSIPIGSLGGRAIRYRVGATRGHYVQGTVTPTAVASGDVFITDQRVVFIGPTQTRECSFAKLVGLARNDDEGTMTLSVSNRQHPTVISYGPEIAQWVAFRTDLALSHWRGDVDEFIEQLRAQVAEIDARRPGLATAPSPPATS